MPYNDINWCWWSWGARGVYRIIGAYGWEMTERVRGEKMRDARQEGRVYHLDFPSCKVYKS